MMTYDDMGGGGVWTPLKYDEIKNEQPLIRKLLSYTARDFCKH